MNFDCAETSEEPCTDHYLLQKIISGDSEAVADLLVERCGPAIKHLLGTRYRGSGLEFHEAISEAWLLLSKNDWSALRAYRGHSTSGKSCSLVSYVICILSRHLWRKYACALQEKERNSPLDVLDPSLLVCNTAERTSPMTQDELMAFIMMLDQEVDRQVIVLYQLEGLSVREVAGRLGISENNLYMRYSRALKKLREKIAEVMSCD